MAYVVCDVDRPLRNFFYSRNGMLETVAAFRYYFPRVSNALLFKDLHGKGDYEDFQFIALLNDKDLSRLNIRYYERRQNCDCCSRPEDKK